ncbi:MAG: N-acetylmuramoyl-L-alanine amidase, partial [Patescibacteria group bacterium]
HVKKTAGKRSPKFTYGTQLLEYKFNRDVVERMVRLLKQKGVKHYVVVPEVDVNNLLEERVRRANDKKSALPRLFVSVHSNAAPAPLGKWCDPKISGIETWYYHNNSRGRKVAAIFQKHLVAATGWKNRHIKSRPTNQFYVLRNTKMTAVLTENGFYNNKAQCLELLKSETKDKIAAAHVDAIMEIEKKGV